MPASSAGRNNAAALLGYVCVALAFAWPLPANASSALYGTPGGDTGVYVWNLWVFRHEIVGHGRFPFYTSEILALNSGAPLTLHNYTSLANVAAFPLLPLLGTVATYNVLMIASGAVSAFAGFVLFRRLSGDAAAAWIGGLLFGFSPFMTARSEHHFSLVQTAALPLFALALLRIEERPTTSRAVVAGALVAAAFLCDPYYAVYCLLMAAFAAAWLVITVERGAARAAPAGLRLAVNVAIMCLGGLVLGIVLRGGGRIDFMGLRVSMTRLYTPVLILTLLVLVRAWIALRPRVGWMPAAFHGLLRPATVAAAACTVMLSPVLTVMAAHIGERQWIAPRTFWRSSPAGLDLLAFLVPNPTSPVVGWMSAGWLASAPGGFIENVAAIPWTATFAVAIAILYAGWRPPRYWIWFTAGAALLALGPFVQIAGMSTYVPTPWAVLRYLPVIGAARMPPRFAAVVMLGAAVLLAFAVTALRRWSRRAWVPTAIVAACLLVELLPAPRRLHELQIPSFYARIADDPRPLRVLTLPFGLRDGTSSIGNFSASTQFYQTFHEKPLLGGYLSRLPNGGLEPYRRLHQLTAMTDLSAGLPVSAAHMEDAIERIHLYPPRLAVGYVVMHRELVSTQLRAFARAAFDLEYLTAEVGQELYRTPLATGAMKRRWRLDR